MTTVPTSAGLGPVRYVVLHVIDVAQAVPFYRDKLGFSLLKASNDWAELDAGGPTIALRLTDRAMSECGPTLPEVVFDAADIRAAVETLRARGVPVKDPRKVCEEVGTVGLSAKFHDPAGNHLALFGFVPARDWRE